jgi:ABC-type transport system involved in multi-copper enzyme maturation permease subunit
VSPVITIALVTLREAVRRKIVAACAVVTIGLVGLSAWGFDRLSHTSSITSGEVNAAVPQALILFMFMFSFVLALSASAMAAPAVSTEIESGVLLSVLARPVRRSEVLLGKWLGLATIILAYSAAVSGLEVGVVDWVSGFVPPDPILVAFYLFAEGAVLLTLTLLLSTRLSAMATGVVTIALFGAAWLAGVVGSLGTVFKIHSLETIGSVSRYVLPTDGLWRGATYYLESQSFITQRLAESSSGGSNDPFFASSPPSWAYLLWAAVWFLFVLGVGLVSFERREL